MKIYLDLQKQAITKTTDEKTYEGDFYSNVFEVLFYNYTDTNWFPTMSQLAPNGRKAGEFTADALNVGESHEVTEDGVTYLKFDFTMGANWVLMKGRSEFYIWFNRLGGAIVQKKCVGVVNVMIDQSTTDYFIADPTFNPNVKAYIDACIAELGDGSPKYFDTASNIANCTEDKGLAVATDTGHLYYWDETKNSTTKYTDSGLVYNDLSAYYTITQMDALLASKVNKADVADNLTTNDSDKVLSAKQGKILKDTLDGVQEELDSIQALENLDNIVGSYSELESLITVGEPTDYQLNAKVQVLNDSTHDGNSTLYNLESLDIINGLVDNYIWRFVGYYDGYNKEQIDEIINDFEQSVTDNFNELSGQLEGALTTQNEKIEELGTLQPSGADTTTNITSKTAPDGIWISTTDGHWYYWDGTQYVDGGVYQATELPDDVLKHHGNQLIDSDGNNIYPALEPEIIINNQDWTLINDSGWVPLANTRRFVINYGNEIPVNDTFNLSLQAYYSNNLEYTLLVEIWIVNGTTLTKVDSYTYTCPTHSSMGFYENKIIESKKNTYGYPILITVANPNGNTIKYGQSMQDNKLYNFSDLSSSTLNLSNLSFIDGYNFRYYLSYTTDVINNTKDDIDTINGKLNSYVTVKKDGTGDYTTISDALNNVPEGTPIIVYEGIYEENIKLINTAVNIRGVDKNKCIIKSKNGGYDYPTLYVKSGILKDLTIIAEYVQGTSTEIGTLNGAYAIHIESEASANTTMEIDNCILKSDFSAAAGIGLRTGATFILRNSVLINNQVSGRGSYESNGGLGALYCHDSMGVEGNSKVELYNNLFISNLGSSICFYHVPNKDENSVNMICTNNVLKDKINGYNNNIWNRNNAFDYFSIDVGYGNSNSLLNN